MSKSFKEFRIDTFCMLDEAGLDDYVAGKAISGVKKTGSAAKSGASKATAKPRAAIKTGAQKAKAFGTAKVKSGLQKVKTGASTGARKAGQKIKKVIKREEVEEQALINEVTASANDVIVTLRTIVRKSQMQKIKLLDGKQISVDLMTAGAVTSVYDALNPRNKVKFASTLAKDLAGFHKMSAFAIKNVSY
jgi:hypothetical protein